MSIIQPVPPLIEPTRATPARGLALQVRGLTRQFGDRRVLTDLDLDVEAGQFLAVVGRSGCGKSTLLRVLAGLDAPSAGEVLAGGRPLDRAEPAAHGIRLMFQEARLLPWKRVGENVALGLDGPDRAERVRDTLACVGLLDRIDDWPAALSGGQRQRVALARALVHRPRLLLLDEPLGALDALTRIEMQELIERVWKTHGFTAVLVTHDVSEAVALADRILLIEDQKLALDHTVSLARPRNRGSAAFAKVDDAILQRVLRRSGANLISLPRPPAPARGRVGTPVDR